jgi:oligoribonuclease NrnB/cAMP/cGMP phosphodiesterase (DHH superfamily)
MKLEGISKIVTHANCSDGTMSAAIIRQALPRVEVVEMNYNTPQLAALKPDAGLLFCDFSPPPDRAEEFLAAGTRVLDHHKGAQSVVQHFVDAGLGAFGDETKDPGVSGAVLAYEHVYVPIMGTDSALGQFARLVGIRDTWQKNSQLWDMACQASAGLRAFPFDYWMVNRPILNDTIRVLGKATIDGRTRQVKEAMTQLETFEAGGLRFAVFSDPKSLTSDLAELVRQENIADVLVGFFFIRDKADDPLKLVFSCRSNDRFDVSALCKANGGGGHTRAAGFSVVVNPWKMDSPYILLRHHVLKFLGS